MVRSVADRIFQPYAGLVDALRVVHEVVLRLDADHEGAVRVQLLHHLALVRAAVVPADVAVLVRARRPGAVRLQQALLVALLVVRAPQLRQALLQSFPCSEPPY